MATHALNIFGDHSDVMACRQTGFAMLCESNPQEVMDLGAVAHLAAIKGRVPFINFFDGFRTSHEIQKIAIWDNEDLADMVDMDAVEAFRKRALNPERPVMRGSHENGDIFFQHREAANKYYDALEASGITATAAVSGCFLLRLVPPFPASPDKLPVFLRRIHGINAAAAFALGDASFGQRHQLPVRHHHKIPVKST